MSSSDEAALYNSMDHQSVVILEKNLNGRQPDFNDFDAVLTCVSRMDIIKKLRYREYSYMIDEFDPIEVARNIMFCLTMETDNDRNNKSQSPTKMIIRLYSDVLPIVDIKQYIQKCRTEFESQRNNKLGDDMFFFDQVTANDTKFATALSFDKKKFTTFRTFENVFFEERDDVTGRVRHFLDNKAWYMKRGIPYTLGFMFHGPPGTGKCLRKGTRLIKYDGTICSVEELKPNDLLMGDGSEPRIVQSICNGRDTMYRVHQGKGESYDVNSVHILSVKLSIPFIESWHKKEMRYKLQWFENFELKKKCFTVQNPEKKKKYMANFSTKELAYTALLSYKQSLIDTRVANRKGDVCDIPINEYIQKSADWKHAFKGFKRGIVDWWPSRNLQLDPYMMGYWIGDGTSADSAITSQDASVLKYFAGEVPKMGPIWLQHTSKYTYRITSGSVNGANNGEGCNIFRSVLKHYGVWDDKHVPRDYQLGSVEQRRQLLAGFLDADGHLTTGNVFEFCQKSRQIFDDIIFVARSLGYQVSEGVPKNVNGILYYRANIIGADLNKIPTKIPRKRACEYRHNKDPMVYDIRVEKLEEDDYYGFTLDGNGRFCLKDFTITHNTSCIKAIANITKRHIINVRLSEVRTNTQLKNLFFNQVLQVVNPDTLTVEKFVVPIHQRLYVIEDIDCMTDLIKRRDLQLTPDDDDVKQQAPVKPRPQPPKKTKSQAEFLDGDEELASYYEDAVSNEINDMSLEIKEDEKSDRITLDSLLNILDGTLEIPDRMFCITTNHLDIIDPALIRPGRVDMIVEFKYCTRAIIKQMFESFYERVFDGAKFSKIRDYKISPAFVNQVLFKHFTRPESAIEELTVMANKRKTYKKREKDDDEN